MKKDSIPPDDDFMIRCPKLGHQIYFSYCRSENQGAPCFKTLDCWYTYFLVEEYLREALSPEAWERSFGRPRKSKTVTLLELIEQAKKRQREET